MSNSWHRVFVYGTLKSGFPNHGLLKSSQNGVAKILFSAKTSEKYPLVVASSSMIPFLLDLPGTGNQIHGEVYEVDDAMMVCLDKLEDVGVLYTRQMINVHQMTVDASCVAKDSIVSCHAYLLQSFKSHLLNLTMLDKYTHDLTIDYIAGRNRDEETNIAKEVKTI